MTFRFLFPLLFAFGASAQRMVPLHTHSKASLRGLHALSAKVCWSSGSTGTVLRTRDGGQSFEMRSPKGYDSLQFRDIHAFSTDTALVLSAGLPAVVLKTTDGGLSWRETYRNEQKGVFFDGMDFWDKKRGMAFSDAPYNKLLIISTRDQGENWQMLDTAALPAVAPHQGGFAASGTSLCTFGEEQVVIGLGGNTARLLYSADGGQSWQKQLLPIDAGTPSSGIFSIDFINSKQGFAVGGDYLGDSLTLRSAAYTEDGGRSWQPVKDTAIHGHYRSCVAYVSTQKLLAVSRTGISLSADGGKSWKPLEGHYYSVSVGKDGSIWLSGNDGRMARMMW